MAKINTKEPTQYKVAAEVAESEFARWCAALGLDAKFDEDFVDPVTFRSLSAHKNTIVRAIMKGHAHVDEKMNLVFTPQFSPHKDPMVFRRPKGSDFKLMDQHQGGSTRNFALLSSLSGQNDDVFDELDMLYDGDFCASLVALFLA